MKKIIDTFYQEYKNKKDTWLNHAEKNIGIEKIGEDDVIVFAAKDIITDMNKHIDFLKVQKSLIEQRIEKLELEKQEIIKSSKNNE